MEYIKLKSWRENSPKIKKLGAKFTKKKKVKSVIMLRVK